MGMMIRSSVTHLAVSRSIALVHPGGMLKRMITLTLVAVTSLTLGGCGEDKADMSSAKSIADTLKAADFTCVSFSENKEAVGPLTAGTCMHEGREIEITTFSSEEDRKRLIEQAQRAFGETTGPTRGGTVIAKDGWMVTTNSQSDAAEVQKILGGERQ